MSLHLPIRDIIIISLLFLGSVGYAQSDIEDINKDEEIGFNKRHKTRQKYATFSIGYHNPITSGDNYFGNALEGSSGIDFSFQFYIYRQFVLGVSANSSYFDVKDQTIVGNYKKTTLNEQFLYVGYEFLPTNKLRLGVLVSIIGNARFKNKFRSQPLAYQIDYGNLGSYGFNIKYEIGRSFMIHIDYAYRTSKTDIKTPLEIQKTFSRASYHNIGFGLTFTIGSKDMLSRLIE